MPSETKPNLTSSHAPGQPGLSPRWTSSRKEGIGTALNPLSRLWFTVSHGIVNEVYYPRVDRACTRDLELIVTDGQHFFSEEKRDTNSKTEWMAEGVPAFEIVNSCKDGRYKIKKQILADPNRHVLLQKVCFEATKGNLEDYRLYVLLAPHLHNFGMGNTAWVGEFKGVPMLMAERDGTSLALACSAPWVKRSAGFVGMSDGWQDLHAHKRLEWEYACAEDGNVALTGEIEHKSCRGEFLLALGFGRSWSEAAHRVRASLIQGFAPAWEQYRREWEDWQKGLLPLDASKHEGRKLYRSSTAVINAHEAKDFPGGTIASLSIPWGMSHGDKDLGGYHLVWPRDTYEACSAMLAAGAKGEARRAMEYFEVTQEADGHWPQNMWLDGSEYWKGRQLDETAAPILLLELARREGLLKSREDHKRLWPMVRKAACYIVQTGPGTEEDRWEKNSGYSPFTLATEVAALLVAANLANEHNEADLGEYLRQTADAWNDAIEDWTYASGTELARKLGVDGYYVRLSPSGFSNLTSSQLEMITIKDEGSEQRHFHPSQIVSPDALALVRFGLRAPDDPRILNTIKVIDALLKVETPFGPAWHRYNHDGYGEHADGSPFDGIGIGRAWPLLTGERAHYELAAGHLDEARRLLATMEKFADESGMLPEQIWDSEDIPEKELYFGRPSGSARPLVWAHAEYVKLLRSLQNRAVFDQPPHAVQRYLRQKAQSDFGIWRFTCQNQILAQGRKLRIETRVPAQVHWTDDDWLNIHDINTRDTGVGIHVADLPTQHLDVGRKVIFTFYWPQAGQWEGQDFSVTVTAPRGPSSPEKATENIKPRKSRKPTQPTQTQTRKKTTRALSAKR